MADATVNLYPPGIEGSVTVQDEGIVIGTQPALNFTGPGVTATLGVNRIDVAIPGVAGATDYMTFATIAALGATASAGLDDQSVAWVCTVADQWVLHKVGPLAAATIDGITVIAALDGGRWIRQLIPSQEWASQYAGTTQEISTAGSDEATGLTGFPLRTAAELQRRLGRLNVAGAQTVNITVGNLGAADPFRKTWTNQTGAQTGNFKLGGVLTQVATGSVTAVTARVLTTDQSLDITPSASLAAQLGRFIRFLVGAGPAVRCEGWVAADLGAGIFRISDADNGSGVYTSPVALDTYQVFTQTEIPDATIDLMEPSQGGHELEFIRVNNAGGGNFAQLNGWSQFDRCDINAAMYFNNQASFTTLQNCRYTPPDATLQGRLYFTHGLLAPAPGGGTAFGFRGREVTQLSLHEVVFQGTSLSTRNLSFVSEDTPQVISIYAPAGVSWTAYGGTKGWITRFRGDGVASELLVDATEEIPVDLTFENTPTAGTGFDLGGGTPFAWADISGVSLTSPHGDRIAGPGSVSNVINAVVVTNGSGATRASGDVVRMTGAAFNVTTALADTEANSRVAGILLSSPPNTIAALMATSGPLPIEITGAMPTVGDDVYLSATVAARGQAAKPAISATNQMVVLGKCVRTSGTKAFVDLDVRRFGNEVIEQPVVLTDGATVTIDPTQGRTFIVTIAGNRTLDISVSPTTLGWPKKLTIHVIQDPTGGRTLTPTTGAGKFLFGTDVTSMALSAGANTVDLYAFEADTTLNRWLVSARARGFV